MTLLRHLLGRWRRPRPSELPDLPPYLLRDIGLPDDFNFSPLESIRLCNKPVYVTIALGHLYR